MVLILGENNSDKGKQLEQLTKKILQHLKLTDVYTNEISSGGQEIDLTAKSPVQHMGTPIEHKVLCECKAYKNPVSIDAWLKFLGKVFVEQSKSREGIIGYFIALSDVNGPVKGNYEDFKKHNQSVQIIRGEDLTKHIKEIYNTPTIEEVEQFIVVRTDRRLISIEKAYYDNEIYWVISFDRNHFTILDKGFKKLDEDLKDKLSKMVKRELSVHTYVNLEDERDLRLRIGQLSLNLLGYIMINEGEVDKTNVKQEFSNFNDDEINEALSGLEESEEVLINGEKITFPDPTDPFYYKVMGNIIVQLSMYPPNPSLSKPIISEIISSEYYKNLIDDNMIEEIISTQYYIPLSEQEKEELKSILRISPTALSEALTIQKAIENHRRLFLPKLDQIPEHINKSDVKYFFNLIYRSLVSDFTSPHLLRYFYETCKINRIKLTQHLELGFEQEDSIIDKEISEEYVIKLVDGEKYALIRPMKNEEEE